MRDDTENYASKRAISAKLLDRTWPKIEQFFNDQQAFAENLQQYWAAWACEELESMYDGIHDLFLPTVHDAIEAGVKRDMSVVFPTSKVWVGVLGANSDAAVGVQRMTNAHLINNGFMDTMRLGIRTARITGNIIVYVDWVTEKREIPQLDDTTGEEFMAEELLHEGPIFRAVQTENFIILPIMSTIQKAHLVGERRWVSEEDFEDRLEDGYYIADKAFTKELEHFGDNPDQKNIFDAKNTGIGVRVTQGIKMIGVVDVFMDVDIGNGKEPCVVTFTRNRVLRIVKNPFRRGKRPYFAAVRKDAGTGFFGHGDAQFVKPFNIAANDLINQGLDSATYAVNPIFRVQPDKSPNWKTFLLAPGAMWVGGMVEPIQIENLAPQAYELVMGLKQQVAETMGLVPPVPSSTPGRKAPATINAMMQAELQMQEADWIRNLESNVLVPICKFLLELDQDNRQEHIVFAESEAEFRVIEPHLVGREFIWEWRGSTQASNPVKIQQVMTALNILSKIPPGALGDKEINIAPLLDYLFGTLLGLPNQDEIIRDSNISIDPHIENFALMKEVTLPVNKGDNDEQHIQVHSMVQTQASQLHNQQHVAQMLKKKQAQAQQMMGRTGPGGQGPMVNPPGSQPPNPTPKGSGMPQPGQAPMQGTGGA